MPWLSYKKTRTSVTTTSAEIPSVWLALNLFAKDFWKKSYKKALLPLFVIVAVMTTVEQLGWFQHAEATTLDTFSRAQHQVIPNNLIIVEITDDDYKTFFNEHSPLAPNMVLQLIAAVEQGRPAVIGVDLDTRDSSWNCSDLDAGNVLQKDNLIWAQVPEEPVATGQNEEPVLKLTEVLGGRLNIPDRMGLVRFPQDPDGVVRAYRGDYKAEGNLPVAKTQQNCTDAANAQLASAATVSVETSPDTMFHAVAKHWNRDLKPDSSQAEFFNFYGDRFSFQTLQASEFLQRDDQTKTVTPKTLDAQQIERLSNSMVLIGGAYTAARDTYMTPVGKMAGVELIANAIESELNRGIHAASLAAGIILDLLMGSAIVFIYYKLPGHPGKALLASLLAMLILPAAVSIFSFFSFATFINFFPIMIGMLIHQMYEGNHQVAELREELYAKDEEIAQLTAALPGAAAEMHSSAQNIHQPPGTVQRTQVETVELHVNVPAEAASENAPGSHANAAHEKPRAKKHHA